MARGDAKHVKESRQCLVVPGELCCRVLRLIPLCSFNRMRHRKPNERTAASPACFAARLAARPADAPNLSYGQFVLFYSFIALANCRTLRTRLFRAWPHSARLHSRVCKGRSREECTFVRVRNQQSLRSCLGREFYDSSTVSTVQTQLRRWINFVLLFFSPPTSRRSVSVLPGRSVLRIGKNIYLSLHSRLTIIQEVTISRVWGLWLSRV